jgi:prepilin-type N-terminal cleavage/methylation domain-containing protein
MTHTSIGMSVGTVRRPAGERGFTLPEVLLVVGIFAILAGMAMLATPQAITMARADSALQQVIAELRGARDLAVSERRNIETRFIAPNEIQVLRRDVVGNVEAGQTLVRQVFLEGGYRFQLGAGVPDTPDGFGAAAAVDFGVAAAVIFTSEGSVVDQTGDPLNGTVFVGRPSDPQTSRAITVFGPTALVQGYAWNGGVWRH